MAILTQEISKIEGGFSKEIDKAATGLMFDILQQHQYSSPIKSTIREIVSNGLDSLTEKRIAREILTGQAKVEDYFVEREGDIYNDSKFDPSYYDLKYLSAVNEVDVIYTEGGDLEKDRVVIRDHGVGLGGKRLQNYFNLGYSSKRLLSKVLGKFGIGAKAPLSVGVPFYTITSRHNGKEFCFNVYAHRVESLIPRYDTQQMIENPAYEFDNGYVAYYKNTSEPNMFQIEIVAKKHHQQQYIDAVTSQLLYFNDVKLFVGPPGYEKEQKVKADIMYEDDMIVLANNSPYSKPHMLLNGVNYGYINFEELELEQKLGNIGIKVNPDLVSINPSRESLIWDDKTREVVVNRFNEVVGIAQETINRELTEKDFLKWMKSCANAAASNSLWSNAAEDTVIGRLAKIVDMSKMELVYPVDREFRFSYSLMAGMRVSRVTLDITREGSKKKKKVEYAADWRTALVEGLPLFIVKGDLSNRKSKYILTHLYPQGFVIIQLQFTPEDGSLVLPEHIITKSRIEEAAPLHLTRKQLDAGLTTTKVAQERIAKLHNFVLQSADKMWYESVEVPEEFKGTDEEIEEEIEESNKEAEISAAERRKLSGTTILHTPRIAWKTLDANVKGFPGRKCFEMVKLEMPVHLTDTWSNEEIFWSNQDYEPLLHTAALITRYKENPLNHPNISLDTWQEWRDRGYSQVNSHEYDKITNFRDDSPVRLIKVAQNNVKYYRDFKHISKFFKEIRNKTITMSNALIRWNTARLLHNKFEDLAFLEGFSSLSEHKAQLYKNIKDYVNRYWRKLDIATNTLGADDTTTGQLISHMDKVGQFQLFVKAHPDEKDAIAELAKELFNPEAGVEIQDGRAIETEIYEQYLELVDWAQPVKVLMNMVGSLTEGEALTSDQEQEIRSYFNYRDVSL